MSPDSDTRAPVRPRPHKLQSDTLRHLACLIDRTLDDSRLLDPHAMTARHLGCGIDEVAESTIDTTRFRYRLAARGLATFLEQHPSARLSGAESADRPQWEILSLGERHLPFPTSICAAILRRYLEPLGLDRTDLGRLVGATAGASGADLRELARRGVLEHGDGLSVAHLEALARGASWRSEPSTGVYL